MTALANNAIASRLDASRDVVFGAFSETFIEWRPLMSRRLPPIATFIGAALFASGAAAAEFYIGEPVEKEGMQFSPAYLTGIEMDKHPPGMSTDPNAIHIEIDIHAAKNGVAMDCGSFR